MLDDHAMQPQYADLDGQCAAVTPAKCHLESKRPQLQYFIINHSPHTVSLEQATPSREGRTKSAIAFVSPMLPTMQS
jgi:hypothetical protein